MPPVLTPGSIEDLGGGGGGTGTVTSVAAADGTVVIGGTPTVAPTVAVGTIGSGQITDGSIVNADINAAAAIAYSKLTLTGAVLNADLAGSIANTKLATNPLARANHTGTQLAATVSDFDTQVRTSRLDQLVAPNADLSINSHKLTLVTDPSSAQDAATKNYVDNAISSTPAKQVCQYATAAALPSNVYANGTLGVGATLTASANGPLTVDGQLVATGQRILVQNEAAPANNGIYVVTQPGVVAVSKYILTRATDFDQAAEVSVACLVPVDSEGLTPGAVNDAKVFLSITASPFTVGTTSITFVAVGNTYTAGSGLTLSGNQFSIGTGQVTSGMILDGTVANADLANMANASIKARRTAGTGAPEDITLAQLVALGGTPDGTKFLRDDGTLATPAGGIPSTTRITSGDYATGSVGFNWREPFGSASDKVIAAATGDVVGVALNGQWALGNSTDYLDIMVVGTNYHIGDNTTVAIGSSSTSQGAPGWAAVDATASTLWLVINGGLFYTVQSGDLSGGNLTLRIITRTTSGRTLRANTTTPLLFTVINYKH